MQYLKFQTSRNCGIHPCEEFVGSGPARRLFTSDRSSGPEPNREPGPASGHSPAPLVQLTVAGDKARLMPPSHTACISPGTMFPHYFGRVGVLFFAWEFRSLEGELNNGAKSGF